MTAIDPVAGSQLLAHVGPLATHDLWLVIPMAVLSAVIIVVMVRPRRPLPPPDDQPDAGPPPGTGAGGRSGPGPTGGYR